MSTLKTILRCSLLLCLWGCRGTGAPAPKVDPTGNSEYPFDMVSDAGDLTECDQHKDDTFDSKQCETINAGDPCIFYVDGKIPTPGDGTAWDKALPTIQQGIDSAYCGADRGLSTCQVWVKKGTYTIYRGCRYDAVRLKTGVEVYGGFRGDESHIEDRDWRTNETVLLGTNDTGLSSNTVVIGANNTVLDGVVIEGGYWKEESGNRDFGGGGLFVKDAAMTLENTSFRRNRTELDGGGVTGINSTVSFDNCTFTNNEASRGGAVFVSNSAVRFTNCIFDSNAATTAGAGIFSSDSKGEAEIRSSAFFQNTSEGKDGAVTSDLGDMTISRSTFTKNTSDRAAGAVGHYGGNLIVRDCIFQENASVRGEGGALFSHLASGVTILNSVFWKNQALYSGGAIMHRESLAIIIANSTFVSNRAANMGGALSMDYLRGTSEMDNSILWGNTVPSVSEKGGTLSKFAHNYIEDRPDDGVDGGLVSPNFHDMDAGDFRLLAGSPCIDRANGDKGTATDLLGHYRVDDPDTPNRGEGTIPYMDIGAYEYQLSK